MPLSLIILVTRIAKEQSIQPPMEEQDFDIVRRYNIAVENHYKSKHQVQDYADMLSKSPKTLSNLFALYNHKSPLQIIHERITLEAKRLLIFTEKPTKEIAFELGFEEVAHFSRLFKKVVGNSPTEFKEKHFTLFQFGTVGYRSPALPGFICLRSQLFLQIRFENKSIE